MRNILDRYLFDIPRDGDGAGAGGAGAGGAGAGGAGAGAGGAGAGGTGGTGAWTPPPNLPAHLVGTTADETIGKIFGAYEPLRVKLDQVPKPAAKAEEYELTLDGPLASYGDTLKNDPIMPDLRKLALESGMPLPMFQKFAGGFINIMHDKGAFAPMPSDAKIAEGLVDPALQGTAKAEAITGGTKRLTDARAWVDGLKDTSGFSAHERAELAMMVNSPGGVSLVERMMKAGNQSSFNPGGQSDANGNAVAEYEKRLQDPRNKTDTALAAETREMSKRVFAKR